MRSSQQGDWWAMALSLSCAFHCILQPVLMAAIPLIGFSLLYSPWFEAGSILFTLSVSVRVMWSAHAHHRRSRPLIFLGAGCFLLTLDTMARMHLFEARPEWVLTASGCLFLMAAHLTNLRCRGAVRT